MGCTAHGEEVGNATLGEDEGGKVGCRCPAEAGD